MAKCELDSSCREPELQMKKFVLVFLLERSRRFRSLFELLGISSERAGLSSGQSSRQFHRRAGLVLGSHSCTSAASARRRPHVLPRSTISPKKPAFASNSESLRSASVGLATFRTTCALLPNHCAPSAHPRVNRKRMRAGCHRCELTQVPGPCADSTSAACKFPSSCDKSARSFSTKVTPPVSSMAS